VIYALRAALRPHLRHRGFALTVVLTLAITTGATTAVFSAVNAVLMRALPFVSPDRLVWIASVRSDNPDAPFTLPEFLDYRDRTRTLAGLAAYANWSASLSGSETTERLQGARMSGNAFDVLGITPAAGRILTDGDDRADAPRVVMISYRLWQGRFGGAADAVGRALRIDGESFVVAGVLPAQFPLPLRDIDVVKPLSPDRDPLRHVRGSTNFLRLFGRLAPGMTAARAEADLTAICQSLKRDFPTEYARKEAVRVTTLQEALVGESRQPMLLAFAAVAIVLATALANLTSLALVRANGRRAEFSMRLAIGATGPRLVRQLALEAAVLAAAGALLGVLLAAYAVDLTVAAAPPAIPRLGEISLDTRAVLFALGIDVLATILLTAAPLTAVAWHDPGEALHAATRGTVGDRWTHRVRNTMVVAEISAAFLLVVATIVLTQNLRRLQELHPGFNPDGVFEVRLSLPMSYRSPEDIERFYDSLSSRLSRAPGVLAVGVISVAPLSGSLATVPFSVVGHTLPAGQAPSANIRAISPGYLSTVGTVLVEGRPFTDDDRSTTRRVALVSAVLSERFFSGRAIGQRLLIDDNNTGPRSVDIVGIVENVRQAALDLPPALDIYIPLRQIHPDGVPLLRNNQFWMIRTRSDPGTFRHTFLMHLRAVDRDVAVSASGTLRQSLDSSLAPRRFTLALFAGFAVTAVLLAVLGVYGLVSYAVSQRTPEIGLRMAIGATPRQVKRMILGQALRLGLTGAATGLALVTILGPALARAFRDASVDARGMMGTALALIVVVWLAARLPAGRAARTDPTVVLRDR
jgi:predicted permease